MRFGGIIKQSKSFSPLFYRGIIPFGNIRGFIVIFGYEELGQKAGLLYGIPHSDAGGSRILPRWLLEFPARDLLLPASAVDRSSHRDRRYKRAAGPTEDCRR